MKSWMPVILLVVLFGAGFIYQYKAQQDSAQKLREEILGEWEERKKMEDSIKKEMETKRRDQEFIKQMNYQGQLEDLLGAKLNGVLDELTAFKSNLETAVNSRLNGYEESFLDFKQHSGAKLKELQEYIEQLRKHQSELEGSVNQCLRIEQKSQEDHSTQFINLKQEIRELRKKIIALDKHLNSLQSQAAPAKQGYAPN
jgi:hypothetical protein